MAPLQAYNHVEKNNNLKVSSMDQRRVSGVHLYLFMVAALVRIG